MGTIDQGWKGDKGAQPFQCVAAGRPPPHAQFAWAFANPPGVLTKTHDQSLRFKTTQNMDGYQLAFGGCSPERGE
ncbi:hypothetical protein CC2G_004966 [Coprinopsis cinerea AmutBmut pab1-1]|nr:hypothetical protein CC2G_004966 [Coprinopsis cinerea AmutBmut pab1-1]